MAEPHISNDSSDTFALIAGRIEGNSSDNALAGYHAELWRGKALITSTVTGNDGRFVLEAEASLNGDLGVVVLGRDGRRIGQALVRGRPPNELIFPAVDQPYYAQPTSGDLLDPEATGVVYRVVLAGMEAGTIDRSHGIYSETAWMHLSASQLIAFDAFARGVIEGDPGSVDGLRGMLRSAPHWPLGHGKDLPERPASRCGLTPLSPYHIVTAGLLLDAIEPDGEPDFWLEQALGFYLARSATIGGVQYAAFRCEAGEIDIEEFAATLNSARHFIDPEYGSNMGGMGGATTRDPIMVTGKNAGVLDKMDWFNPMIGGRFWDNCSIQWGRCSDHLADASKAQMQTFDIPVIVGAVNPAAVCSGWVGTLTLTPRSGSSFPAVAPLTGPNDGLRMTVAGVTHPLTPVPGKWGTAEIQVLFPSGAGPGCGQIYWQGPVPLLSDSLETSYSNCADLLGIGPISPITPIWPRLDVASIAILGGTVELLANGRASLLADACTDVTLSWMAEMGQCSGQGALGNAAVTLERDGQPILTGAPLRGHHIVREETAHTYRLLVKTSGTLAACAIHSSTVIVSRVSRLRLEIEDRIFQPGSLVMATIRLPCPAPIGGLQVTFTSTAPAALASTAVTIPTGELGMHANLGLAAGTGTVLTVTATAPGFISASQQISVFPTSCAPVIPNHERYGGRWDLGPVVPVAIGVSLAVLHSGKVLVYSYDEGSNPSDFFQTMFRLADSNLGASALWDPATGAVDQVPLARNLFCSGSCFLGDGKLLVVGGEFHTTFGPSPASRDLHVFDPLTEAWVKLPQVLSAGRWYPTCITMPNGNAFITSGSDADYANPPGIQNSWLVFNAKSMSVGPPVPMSNIFHLFPFAQIVPDGRIFLHWKRTSFLLSPNMGDWASGAQRTGWPLFGGNLGTTRSPVSRTGSGPGTCVLLPLIPVKSATGGPAVWPPGRLMIIGGGGAEPDSDPPVPGDGSKDAQGHDTLTRNVSADATTEVLDLADQWPQQWAYAKSMRTPRVMPDAVHLPDGKLLVVNGAQFGRSGGFLVHLGHAIGASAPASAPEIYDPLKDEWQTMCSATLPRLYHATAALLPDGRVVVAGHDGFNNAPPFDFSQHQLELFSPPYLFRGSRPQILFAQKHMGFGGSFFVRTDQAADIDFVTLIRQTSVTHQTNTDQRSLRLPHTSVPYGVALEEPPSANYAPPGWYMLFLVDKKGAVSHAAWVNVS